ncbi:GDYXXLXY domain-containing protein [Lentisphaerota bacterium ZTH]|nr:GDYXXLXY domain-containing protein [Lentisphaerota bacterium]WET07370.1 GDYXXLXY domain-containing protein [Lentisphaerota bacterium ZTH]
MNRIERIAVNWVLFIIVSLAVLAVPLYMIFRAETVLSKGNLYLFKVEPRDPYDPFRGRYLDIRVQQNYVENCKKDFSPGEVCYAVIAKDAKGFAYFSELSTQPPAAGDYIRVKFRWKNKNKSLIELPFGRYFVNEKIAPEADKLLAGFFTDPKDCCVLKVKVKDGQALVSGLNLNGIPIEEVVKRKMTRDSR